jgi:hypothetical protein
LRHRLGLQRRARDLLNPRYTGRQVWNKQPKSEVLLDVNDVAQGHTTKQKWNDPSEWIWSEKPVHKPLIDEEIFTEAQALLRAKGSADERSPRRTDRAYALRGLMRYGICGRKMQGSWNNGKPHYRWQFLSQYTAKNKVSHPASVCLREGQLLPHLDEWLSRKFDPIALASTVREFEAAQGEEPKPDEDAQREIAECHAKLRQHRAALEAGADPVLVGERTEGPIFLGADGKRLDRHGAARIVRASLTDEGVRHRRCHSTPGLRGCRSSSTTERR